MSYCTDSYNIVGSLYKFIIYIFYGLFEGTTGAMDALCQHSHAFTCAIGAGVSMNTDGPISNFCANMYSLYVVVFFLFVRALAFQIFLMKLLSST